MLKSQYFRNKWEQAGNDVRKQWKFVNSFIGNNNESSIKSLKISGIEIISIPEMADSFNQLFSWVESTIVEQLEQEIVNLNHDITCNEVYCENSLFLSLTSEQEIQEIILELKKDSAPGFDQITVKDILNLKDVLSTSLTELVNQVLLCGVFPPELKVNKLHLFIRQEPEIP